MIHGLLQTENYTAALLRTSPGVSDETVAGRFRASTNRQRRARMKRQRRVLLRDTPPVGWFMSTSWRSSAGRGHSPS